MIATLIIKGCLILLFHNKFELKNSFNIFEVFIDNFAMK